MNINLSEETVSVIKRALRTEKNTVENKLEWIEAKKERGKDKELFEQRLEEVNEVIAIFEELTE